jgi:hypothetical protein
MQPGLINLTLPVVIQEIEDVLNEYPAYPYQTAFAIPELRQKLLAYCLSRIPNHYVVEGVQELLSRSNSCYPAPLQERLEIESIVRSGIFHIMRENAHWLTCQLPSV